MSALRKDPSLVTESLVRRVNLLVPLVALFAAGVVGWTTATFKLDGKVDRVEYDRQVQDFRLRHTLDSIKATATLEEVVQTRAAVDSLAKSYRETSSRLQQFICDRGRAYCR